MEELQQQQITQNINKPEAPLIDQESGISEPQPRSIEESNIVQPSTNTQEENGITSIKPVATETDSHTDDTTHPNITTVDVTTYADYIPPHSDSEKKKDLEVSTVSVTGTSDASTIKKQEDEVIVPQAEEEEDEEDDEEGETRCLCGEFDPPDDSGFYIQCESCGVWQHGCCVGIQQDDELDKYWCEQCKPQLHNLYKTDKGETKSIYKPVQDKKLQNEKKKRKRRSSLTDDSKNDLDNIDTLQNNNNNINDISNNNSIDNNSDNSNGENQNPSDTPEDLNSSERKKYHDRKRATSSSREEKQYQRMLEQAILESKKISNPDENDSNIQDNNTSISSFSNDNTNSTNNTNNTQNESFGQSNDISQVCSNDNQNQNNIHDSSTQIKDELISKQKESALKQESEGKDNSGYDEDVNMDIDNNNNNNNKTIVDPTVDKESSIQQTKGSGSSLSASSSAPSSSAEDSKKGSSTSSTATPKSRRSKRVAQSKSRSVTKKKNASNSSNRALSDINKPMKPRLPPQRTTLNEMRRRVAAILEFISRTQWELSQDQSSKDDLVKFVENQQFITQVDSIFENYNDSLKMMDDLTRSLLLWEKKYSDNTRTEE